MPSREQVEKVTDSFMKSNREAGNTASREQVRAEVVRHAKRIERKNNNKK
tara:strand:+ start:4393 stop:4542 length:150 start_codon:yes stop_codon:yes gene_type:complete